MVYSTLTVSNDWKESSNDASKSEKEIILKKEVEK